MKNNRLTRCKAMMVILLAIVVCAGSVVMSRNAFAAGGSVTINVANQSDWPEGTEFTFNLYKVGDFDHDDEGMSIFKLDNKYADAGVSDTLEDASSYVYEDGGEADWTQGWLDTANTLATYINSMESGKPETIGTKTATFGSTGDASFTYTVSENGLYLLVGNAQEVGDYLWTPQPMFISVLDGNKTITFDNSLGVKMVSRKLVFDHNVIKNWIGDNDTSEYVRPDKIAVKLMYGETSVDTVILSKEDDYKYSWKHKVIPNDDTEIIYYPNGDDSGSGRTVSVNSTDAGWSVVELRDSDDIEAAGRDKDLTADADEASDAADAAPLLRYYTTAYTPKEIDATTESFTIDNTFSYKTIRLRKSIDIYDDDGSNVVFSFKITGKDAKGNEIYTNHVGVSFAREDGLTKEVVLSYIPAAVESIEVKEEYTGNYILDGEITITEIKDDTSSDDQAEAVKTDKVAGWEVNANNKHDDHGPKGGIVNRYDHGKDPVQDPGSAPSSDAGGSGGSEE